MLRYEWRAILSLWGPWDKSRWKPIWCAKSSLVWSLEILWFDECAISQLHFSYVTGVWWFLLKYEMSE